MQYHNEAWEFIKYLRNEEADMVWVTKGLGGVPTTIRALNSPEAKSFEDLPVYKNELKYARAWPPFPEMISIARNTITPYAQKAIIGELSPQAAIDKVAEEAKKIIGEMK